MSDVVKKFAGTRVERWVFHPDDPMERCSWPSADVSARLEHELRNGKPSQQALLAAASVLEAYSILLTDPSAEQAISRLRKLRRAERT